ncbi:hypothetical protein [Nesterenkonia muleiensis]|uniref:hypothetical protein n=1 Tax=Nesterenkonia muleiensis TaxID=2282648 RepID=UPI000E76564D|nr:hypothetical protein [Nesterenkonia muleiensis]
MSLLQKSRVVVHGDSITHVGYEVPKGVEEIIETSSIISLGLIGTHSHTRVPSGQYGCRGHE